MGMTLVTLSSLRVSVPVLSAHSTSILAASSTAESRVGRTLRLANARAPIAAASVKVAGSATGIDAKIAVSTSMVILAIGMCSQAAYEIKNNVTNPLNTARLRTTSSTAFCCELTTCAVRTSSAVRPNLVRAPVAVTSATASPRRTSAPAKVFAPALASMGTDSPVNID
jgi:p-aminobenzoyl-glutamate transporter AbgT